jgi:light-regulated signal transduction histidine kinase (bacteriophytochrome)
MLDPVAGETLWMIVDDSARKHAEDELLRSNADLEQFAYAISHDMRQPLRMVSSYLQLIEKALRAHLDDDTRQYLAFALDGAKRMDSMILSLLDFSRVGRKTLPPAPLESRVPLDEALQFLSPEIEASRAVVEVSGAWPAITASRDEMTRLFQNLVGNALKYRAEGQVPRVEVISSTVGAQWRVEVRDNGIGIDPGQTDRLFKVFSRLQSRAKYEGTGVGLALCRKIVEHHEGKIGVNSTGEGQGSTFWFEIPLLLTT